MSKKQKLELTWIGKENRPKLEPRILMEEPEKSYHAKQGVTENDIFDNRLIFGDNLLALKAPEQELSGKVNCVFVDPPYNTGIAPECTHLMVQCMEAWIVADPDVLAQFYGQCFARRSLLARQNLEEETKPDIYDKLARATRKSQKGEYGNIRHAGQILQRIDATEVVRRCLRFATFTRWLTESIEGA